MIQTLFGKDIAFSMRTFRFSSGQILESQNQTISCEFHLDPTDDVPEEQASDCTCYTEDECAGKILETAIEISMFGS